MLYTGSVMDCTPDETGTRCVNCGWEWTRGGKFPRRNCSRSLTEQERRKGMEDRLLHAVDDLVSNGLATRSQEEIGKCLAVCQSCEYWMGDYCAEDNTCPAKSRQIYLMRLTRIRLGCDRWNKERSDARPEEDPMGRGGDDSSRAGDQPAAPNPG